MELQKRYSIAPEIAKAIHKDNERLLEILILVLVGIAAAFILLNVVMSSIRWIRTLACLNNDTQRYFREAQPVWAKIQQHLIYAPLFTKRHSKQMRIGPIEAGILPTRFQFLLFVGVIVMNIAIALYGMEWNGVETTLVMHLRNRLGSMAVMNMIPLVLIAGRYNPLITLGRLPFDTFNLAHRWLGHIVIALSFAHGVCQLYYFDLLAQQMHMPSIKAFNKFVTEAHFLLYGFIAWIILLLIFLTTPTAFRHAFYETFYHLHIALVATTLGLLYHHLKSLPHPLLLLQITIAIWAIERLLRLVNLTYRNLSLRGPTRATVEALPGDCMRVTVRVARPWTFQPGQHVYLTLPTIGLWTSHPFSVAWSETHTQDPFALPSSDPEKGLQHSSSSPSSSSSSHAKPPNRKASTETTTTTISLLIRRRTGFTAQLHKTLTTPPPLPTTFPALLQGPHPSPNPTTLSLTSHGTHLLFAGGIGITHILPYIPFLLTHRTYHTAAVRQITLVWIVRSAAHLEWVREWMTGILGMRGRRECLRVEVWVTGGRDEGRERGDKGVKNGGVEMEMQSSPSGKVRMGTGRPDVRGIVEREGRRQVGSMAVGVCGPGGLADEVRAAVRGVLFGGRRAGGDGGRSVEFWEEGFGW